MVDAAKALADLQGKGLIKHVGLTNMVSEDGINWSQGEGGRNAEEGSEACCAMLLMHALPHRATACLWCCMQNTEAVASIVDAGVTVACNQVTAAWVLQGLEEGLELWGWKGCCQSFECLMFQGTMGMGRARIPTNPQTCLTLFRQVHLFLLDHRPFNGMDQYCFVMYCHHTFPTPAPYCPHRSNSRCSTAAHSTAWFSTANPAASNSSPMAALQEGC